MALSMGRLVEVNGITPFDMFNIKEDQIKEVTDPFDNFAT
jgi:hypothetical protein